MAFDLLAFLKMLLGGFNVPGIEERAKAWLSEFGANYPDLKDRADALAIYLGTTIEELQPELDPDSIRNTLLGIARDVVAGQSGVDPGAWHGGG